MRIASFRTSEGETSYGVVDPAADLDDPHARVLEIGTVFADAPADVVTFLAGDLAETSAAVATADFSQGTPLAELSLLPAVPHPTNLLCIGVNYLDHAMETGMSAAPEYPVIFAKLTTAIAAHGDDIHLPPESDQVDYEAEMGIVITREAYRVAPEDALDVVGGYFTLNDVSARDFQGRTTQWVQGKSFPTFAPTGPFLVTPDELGDPQRSAIRLLLNGEVLQDQNTGDMIFDVRTLVSYLSHVARLQPGDVIATGTPSGIGASRDPQVFLHDGDVVRVEVEGLPSLVNTVRDMPA